MTEPRYTVDDFNTIPGLPVVSNGNGAYQPERDTWLPLNLADLPARPPVTPNLGIIDGIGLVYPGLRHVFSGPPESAKTLAAYLIMLQVIRDGHTALLIDFEMGAYNARDRLTDLGATPEILHHLHYIQPEAPADEDHIALCVALNPHLVVIDASAGAFDQQNLDDNKRQDVGKLARLYVTPFFTNGIATIFLDHVIKNTENRGAYAIGSERKTGAADVHLGFTTITPISRGHNGLYKITTHKDRGGYHKRGTLCEIELRSHPETHQIEATFRAADEVPEGQTWMPTKLMQKISELLQQQTEPISRNQIINTIGGNKDYAATALDHLTRLGYATQTPGPRNAKLIEHTIAFTVLNWETTPLPPTSPDFPPGELHSSPSPPPSPTGKWERGEVETTTGEDDLPQTELGWNWVDELTPPDPAEDRRTPSAPQE